MPLEVQGSRGSACEYHESACEYELRLGRPCGCTITIVDDVCSCVKCELEHVVLKAVHVCMRAHYFGARIQNSTVNPCELSVSPAQNAEHSV